MYHNIINNNNKLIFLLLLLTFITQIKAQQKTLDYNANCIKQNTNCYFNDPNIWSNKVVPALWDSIWLTSPSSIYVVFGLYYIHFYYYLYFYIFIFFIYFIYFAEFLIIICNH